MRVYKLILFSILLAMMQVPASAVMVVEPEISFVTTSPSRHIFQTRVIMKEVGFDHLSTEVQIDWLGESDNSPNDLKVTHSKTLFEAGFHVFGSARFFIKKNNLYLELKGVHTYTYESERFIFLVEPDGVVTQISPKSENQ
jgi:hypothetical protein